jgi:hypothetical protein
MIYVKDPDGNEGVASIYDFTWKVMLYIRSEEVWICKFRYIHD